MLHIILQDILEAPHFLFSISLYGNNPDGLSIAIFLNTENNVAATSVHESRNIPKEFVFVVICPLGRPLPLEFQMRPLKNAIRYKTVQVFLGCSFKI